MHYMAGRTAGRKQTDPSSNALGASPDASDMNSDAQVGLSVMHHKVGGKQVGTLMHHTLYKLYPLLEIELIKQLHDHTSPTFLITYTPLYYITSFISVLSI